MLTIMTRTGDRAAHTTAMQEMERIAARIQECTRQTTTGRTMDSFQDAGENVSRVLKLETQLAGFEDYGAGETTITTRLNKMEMAVRQVNDIATDFRSRLSRATSFGVEDHAFQSYCATQLKEVERLLNTQDEDGRYLFAGENTQTAPVDVSQVVAPGIGGPLSLAYYKGSDTAPVGMIGDGDTVSYGVLAKSDGFARLINALAIGAANAPSQDPNTPQYQILSQAAMPMMDAAATALPDMLQDIGTTVKVIEQSKLRQTEIMMYTKDLLADLTETNLVDSTIELNRASMALQFSLLAHQRLSENTDDLLTALRGMH